MKKKILKTLVGAASFALLLSSCSLMPGLSQPGQDNSQNDPVTNDNRGSALLTGNGRPSASLGEVGDLYLDLSTYDLYVKTDFGWSINGTLKGEQGEPGVDGKDGKDGQDGKDGVDGKDGEDGQDGHDGRDGRDGQDGKDGQDGQDADLTDTGFNFFAVNDNEYSVSAGTFKYYQGEITIPTEFEGKPVTSISGDGFKNSSITSVIIPEGITSIGEHAFDGCSNLGSVTLPSTLNTIGSRAFINCSSLSKINLDNVTSIGEWAFGGCTNLRTVNLSANIYNIGQGAFHDCSRLATINYAGNQNNWQYISTGDYWFLGTRITSITCADGSFNINQYNEEVMVSLDSDYHLVGGYDANNWAPNASNKMNAASIRQIYNINSELGSKLSEKNIKHLYMRQIQIGAIPQTWTSKTLYKNKVREVNGDLTFRVSESTYNPQEDLYTEQRYIPDNGNFNGRNRAEALTSNIFIPSYQSELDENGFCWNNSCVMNVQDGTYIFVMAEYNTNQWSGNPQFGFGLLVISGGDMITNDPLDDEDPSVTKEYTGVYLNEDGTEFARSGGNSLAELYAYNKHLPEKAAEGNTQYGFREWELVSNIDNVVTFKPAFDGCTRGLQFEGNSVYQYVGMTQDVVIPSVWEGKQITSISDRAFQSTDITSVVIPNSITRINYQAFAGCKKLESIVIPDSVTTMDSGVFNNCEKLQSVELSNNLTVINDSMFYRCTSLNDITLPNKISRIESNAFSQCSSLTDIILPDALTYIGSDSFSWSGLSSITIPGNVKTIDWGAFRCCYSLSEVELNNSLDHISEYAFEQDSLLEAITLPESLTYVGNYAFSGCSKLVIYMTLEYKPKAFEQEWSGNALVVYGYKEKIVVDGYTYVLSQREDQKYAQLVKFDAENVTEFSVPEEVNGYKITSISTNAFKDNDTLESVILPETVKEIGSYMFSNCSNLKSITLPEGIEVIGERAFENCVSLLNIELPNTVKEIKYRAFYGCINMTSIKISNNIEKLAEEVFNSCNSLQYNVYERGRYLGNDENPYLIYISRQDYNPVIHDQCKIITDGWNGNSWSYDGTFIIPDSVIYIGYGRFSYSTISEVVIGSGVKTIRSQAFQEVNTLRKVYYKGTKADWGKISIEDNNGCLTRATRYYYSETEPTTEGNFWHYVDGVPTAW